MATIRKIEILNFRAIRSFMWDPLPGINCLIGPGDSGKSTVLDAIDLCLGARRGGSFTDADFFNLEVQLPISIRLTLGDLDDKLRSYEAFADYLRGYRRADGILEDEPAMGLETVLTLSLEVGSDLEPLWRLYSERASARGLERGLPWKDRQALSPSRIGTASANHMSWQRGSVLNRLSDERAEASEALVAAARHARAAFGGEADQELAGALDLVRQTALELGVPIGPRARAMLDIHAASFNGGTVALHSEAGVPLRGLGTGSSRLLIAGLERRAGETRRVVLADEVEYGLEPHRLIRFLHSLGAKEQAAPMQVFLTTHSPVALQELRGDQLFVLRTVGDRHVALTIGLDNGIQGTIRRYPEAFLARSVIACEGASEVGFIRGIDRLYAETTPQSIGASGVALIDCGGGTPNVVYERAAAFLQFGYRARVLHDNDVPHVGVDVDGFTRAGGTATTWRAGRALEDELFLSLPVASCGAMINYAITLHEALVSEQIQSVSEGQLTLDMVWGELQAGMLSPATRIMLGKASRVRRKGWFKSITAMEHVGYSIVGPALRDPQIDAGFSQTVLQLFGWAFNA